MDWRKTVYDERNYLIDNAIKTEELVDEISENDVAEIKNYIRDLDRQIDCLQKLKYNAGAILDYYAYKKQNYSADEIKTFIKEDKEYLKTADSIKKFYKDNDDNMFGYPSNNLTDSYLVQYLKYSESSLGLMNNCGDPFENGNYKLDNKKTENKIVNVFAKKFGWGDKCWGYVTSGGTEGNYWGLNQGLTQFPDAYVVYSSDAHYSVDKYVNGICKLQGKSIVVDADDDGRMNVDKFLQAVEKNKDEMRKNGVVIALTFGTTFTGAIDPVGQLIDILKQNGIKFYCHLDAANFGGMTMEESFVHNIAENVNSISVSLHKFIGTNIVNGVLLARDLNRNNPIDYIGQNDTTILGSRTFPPFSTYQKVVETAKRNSEEECFKNALYFEKLLRQNGIKYFRNDKSNIFVFDDLSEEICKKYQLARHIDKKHNKAFTHVIIMPAKTKEVIENLITDIKNMKNVKD